MSRHNRVLKRDWFLSLYQDTTSFVQGGDLVCIDEAWRFWGTDCKILPKHNAFFLYHRHYVHPLTKVSCDLVVVVQDMAALHRKVKGVLELSFLTTKTKSLGLRKAYRVEMWEGWKQAVKNRVSIQQKVYDKAVFALYSSYSGGAGKELIVDKRQNILNNKSLWMIAVLAVVMFCCAVYYLWGFFRPPVAVHPPAPAVASRPASPGPLPLPVTGNAVAGSASSSPIPVYSPTWRIVGTVMRKGAAFVVLKGDHNEPLRFALASAFKFLDGRPYSGVVDGQEVTAFSGALAAPSGSVGGPVGSAAEGLMHGGAR